jgi:hypothetical protein
LHGHQVLQAFAIHFFIEYKTVHVNLRYKISLRVYIIGFEGTQLAECMTESLPEFCTANFGLSVGKN